MAKKILITGGSGFLGKHVIKKLNEASHDGATIIAPSSKDLDLLNGESANNFILDLKPDTILHMAAKCGGILANKNSPADYLRDNTQMGLNIYESARRLKSRIYSLGSVCMYGMNCPAPFKEEDIWLEYPEPTNAPYGQAKRTLMMLHQTYKAQYALNGAFLIPVNMYGECFSEDTKIATPSGFKNIKDFKIGDLVYTLNPSSHDVEIEKVTATQVKRNNKFVKFTAQTVDIRVTPEHKIYYKTSTAFQKRNAEYFISKVNKKHGMIRFAKNNPLRNDILNSDSNNEIDLSKYIDEDHEIRDDKVRDHKHSSSHWIPLKYKKEDFYQFLGWYISEGSKNSDLSAQISISQSLEKNKEHRDEIEKMLISMNLPVQHDNDRFYFSSRLWCNFIKKEIGTSSFEKRIPDSLINTNISLIKILFDTLMKGDGNKNGKRYNTSSILLKDQIILISMLLGIKLGKVVLDGKCWRISFRKIKTSAVKYKNISYEENSNYENVYCITTEKNHIIYAGRNDKYNWIGQCDNFDLTNSHVVPALINKFVNAEKNNLPLVNCWGTGNATRELLYVGDAAEVIVNCIINDFDCSLPINIGTGNDISIKELAFLIKKLTKYNGQVAFTGEVSDGQPKRKLDVSRAKELLGWQSKMSLENGLIKTIEWYKNNELRQ